MEFLNKYDLEGLQKCIASIHGIIYETGNTKNIPDELLSCLRNELRKFFKEEPLCTSVRISNNPNGKIFGIIVKPYINICGQAGPIGCKSLQDIPAIKNYALDIDSRIFNFLSPNEVVSVLLYDIYTITSQKAMEDIAITIDAILAGRKECLSDKAQRDPRIGHLMECCILDTLYRMCSVFAKNDNDLVRVPQLLTSYELDSTFVNAIGEIAKNKADLLEELVLDTLMLNWGISVACNYQEGYVDVAGVLRSLRDTTSSELYKNLLNATILKFLENRHILKEPVAEASLFSSIRKNGLKSLENDLYEYEMRVRNIDDENSAILLMRQINSRMGIIYDYLEEEKISDNERRRWQSLYDRYEKLRTKMSSKPVYSRKMYGLYTDYNALCRPGAENMITMNTIY